MKTSKLYWCDHCCKQVQVTLHEVTEPSEEPLGETTWEATIEKRCSICANEVPDTELVTNRTGGYIKAHARIEQEAGRPAGITIAEVVEGDFSSLRFGPHTTVEQIAEACELWSTDSHEVVGHISFVSGKPVVALRRELRPAGLDAVLRSGSDLPLMLRRQAS